MKKQDPALSISNPRLLAAIYFGLLSVVGTIIVDAFLTSLGIEQIIPVFEAVVLGVIIASCMGAIFGESIVHCTKPYKAKTFWLGFIMVIASLPVFALGLILLMKEEHAAFYQIATLKEMIFFYLVVLAYSYALFGILLAVASGLAAMYLRGYLVYDILHKQQRRRHAASKQHALVKNKPGEKVHR